MRFPKGHDIWNGEVRKLERDGGGFMELLLLETDNGDVYLEIEEMITVCRQMLNANVLLATDLLSINHMSGEVEAHPEKLENHELEYLRVAVKDEQERRSKA
jgi:hypothetical protein|tara:strand:+ start:459 stop:764 length:306 start_codon:yes stop_codon:yes gene_type:complete